MNLSRYLVSLSLLGLSYMANGHLFVYSVNGKTDVVRVLPENRNFPVLNPYSEDMICGLKAPAQAESILSVKAGEEMTIQYYHNGPYPNDDIVESSHIGPCLVFLSKYTEDISDAKWFKIFEDGYTDTWCVLKLISDRGALKVTLPKEIEDGRYVMRTDIIALQEADTLWRKDGPRGAQYYPHCVDIEVTGGKGLSPDIVVSIPGFMTAEDNVFDVYNRPHKDYVIPPPAVTTFSKEGSDALDENKSGASSLTPMMTLFLISASLLSCFL